MAAAFCCSVPSRSASPQEEQARPLKQWKSLAAIRHPKVNESQCLLDSTSAHPSTMKVSEDLELRRIFVAASLPEDHPDALRLPDRKPSLDDSIICSPSLTKKLRRQLSRKSLASSKSGAKSVRFKFRTARPRSQILGPVQDAREDHAPEFCSEEQGYYGGYDPDASSIVMHESRLASLNGSNVPGISEGFSRPQDVDEVKQEGSDNHVQVRSAKENCSQRRSTSMPGSLRAVNARTCLSRAKSTSSSGASSISLPESDQWQLRRSLIDVGTSWNSSLQDILSSPGPEHRSLSVVQEQSSPLTAMESNTTLFGAATVHVIPGMVSKSCSSSRDEAQVEVTTLMSEQHQRSVSQPSNQSIHLWDLQIPQHLRSQSQQTDMSSIDENDQFWSKRLLGHASINSVIWSSAGSQHRHDMAIIDHSNTAASPLSSRTLHDASSSIYSRSPSSEVPGPYDVLRPAHLPENTSLSNMIADGSAPQVPVNVADSASDDCEQKHLHDINIIEHKATDPLPAHQAAYPDLLRERSESSTTATSQLSDLKDDQNILPVMKSSKKRRSLLQFLFPKLVRSKLRSVSTPALWDKTSLATAMFDGPSDDPDFLRVPGHAGERQRSVRSFSSQQPQLQSGSSHPSPTTGPSLASLADYELTLSVSGDDRRRKSAIGPDVLTTVQQHTRQDSGGQPLRRAQPSSGRGTEGSLMEKALHQHHLEKAALFRTSSRRSTKTAPPSQALVFNAPFESSTHDTMGCTPSMIDNLDPLETPDIVQNRPSQSMQDLRSSQIPQTTWIMLSPSQVTAQHPRSSTMPSERGRRRSSAPLATWSRYPSHTRERRCGSASRADNIITQDFAYTNQLQKSHSPSNSLSSSPMIGKGRSKQSVQRGRHWMVKSRSMTFGNVMRYYSNMITSSTARNRRSSIATGGKLEHPELEMLPPIFPAHSFASFRHRHASGASHLEDFVHHVKDEIKEEGHHIKEEIMEETHHLRDEIVEEGQHLKDEAHEVLAYHAHSGIRRCMSDELVDPLSPPVHRLTTIERGIISEDYDSASVNPSMPANLPEDPPIALDGTTEETAPAQILDGNIPCGARRFSQMYQAYIQPPTALDAGSEFGQATLRNTASPDINIKDSHLAVPTHRQISGEDGSVIRRFPSVTVVDDRKGHWRSISLISAQSGKSLRNSTNDLLDLIVKAKNMEHENLMKDAKESTENIGVAL